MKTRVALVSTDRDRLDFLFNRCVGLFQGHEPRLGSDKAYDRHVLELNLLYLRLVRWKSCIDFIQEDSDNDLNAITAKETITEREKAVASDEKKPRSHYDAAGGGVSRDSEEQLLVPRDSYAAYRIHSFIENISKCLGDQASQALEDRPEETSKVDEDDGWVLIGLSHQAARLASATFVPSGTISKIEPLYWTSGNGARLRATIRELIPILDDLTNELPETEVMQQSIAQMHAAELCHFLNITESENASKALQNATEAVDPVLNKALSEIANSLFVADSHMRSNSEDSFQTTYSNERGYQTLHTATENGDVDAVSYLIKQGATPDIRDPVRKSPLHFAAAAGHLAIAENLLMAGADPNARDSFSRTPLLDAVSRGQEHVVKLLLEAGADPTVIDVEGRSLLSLTDEQHGEAIRQLLALHGTNVGSVRKGLRMSLNTVPILVSPHFVPREGIVSELHNAYDDERCVTLIGLGGSGKTQIAVFYAERLQYQQPETSVLWIDASSDSRIQSGYQYLVQRAGLLQEDDQLGVGSAAAAKWLESSDSGRWLLIFDNIDDHRLLQKISLPKNPVGRILLTTRNARIWEIVGGTKISIPALSEDLGHKMLSQYLGRQLDLAEARKLLDKLGHLPLAIAQAAAFIRQTCLSVQSYEDLFTEGSTTAAELLDQEFEDHRGPWELPNSVSRTWAISFAQIQQSNAHAGELLALLSVLDSSDCPKSLLDGLATSEELERATEMCLQFSFIQRNESGSLRMHALVQTATREWLRRRDELSQWEHYALSLVSAAFPRVPEVDRRKDCVALLSHAETVLEYDTDFDGGKHARITLLESTAAWYMSIGQLEKAEDREEKAMNVKLQELGERDPDTLESMENLVKIYLNQGRLKEAEELAHHVFSICRDTLEKDAPQVLTSARSLAMAYMGQGRYSESENILLEVLSSRQGERDLETLSTMNNLGGLYALRGDYVEAENLFRDVLKDRERTLGSKNLSTLISMANLSSVFQYQGLLEDAEMMNRKVIRLATAALGEEYPDTLVFKSRLVGVLLGQQNYNEAEETARTVLEARRKIFGADHPDSLESLKELAMVKWRQGELGPAEQLLREVSQSRRKLLGDEHPDTLASLDDLFSLTALDEEERSLDNKQVA